MANCCGYISSCNRCAHIWYTKTPWYRILFARWHLIDKIYPPMWNMFLFIWISFAIPFSDLSSSVSFFSLSISVSSSKFFFSDSCNLLQKNTNKKKQCKYWESMIQVTLFLSSFSCNLDYCPIKNQCPESCMMSSNAKINSETCLDLFSTVS